MLIEPIFTLSDAVPDSRLSCVCYAKLLYFTDYGTASSPSQKCTPTQRHRVSSITYISCTRIRYLDQGEASSAKVSLPWLSLQSAPRQWPAATTVSSSMSPIQVLCTSLYHLNANVWSLTKTCLGAKIPEASTSFPTKKSPNTNHPTPPKSSEEFLLVQLPKDQRNVNLIKTEVGIKTGRETFWQQQ